MKPPVYNYEKSKQGGLLHIPLTGGSQLDCLAQGHNIMEVNSMLLGGLLGLVNGLLAKILGIVGGIGLL